MILLAILAAIAAAISAFFFRKGGIYNKIDPNVPVESHQTHQDAPGQEPVPESSNGAPSPDTRLYNAAYSFLGEHLTMNNLVGAENGCAQAVSFILHSIGYSIPKGGISTVAAITDWMLANGFTEAIEYAVGYVIVGRSPTDAHVGITGKEWIMSNSSYTDTTLGLHGGLFEANYHLDGFKKTFPQVRFYIPPQVPTMI